MTDVTILKAHIAINVRSVEKSIDFYQKMLGIEPSKVRKRVCQVRCAETAIELHA